MSATQNEPAKQIALEIQELLRRVDSLPTLDQRPEDKILGDHLEATPEEGG